MRLLLLLMLAGGGCAGAPPVESPSPAPVEAPAAFAAPEQLGTLRLTERHAYEEASAGTLYRYGGAGAFTADVFVFPREGAETLTMQTEAFLEGLEIQRMRRVFDAYEVEEHEEATALRKGGTVTGRRIRVVMSRGPEHRRSHFYLFPVGGDWVKVRITHPPEAVVQEDIDRFVQELLASG
jgi:hypothetical protein